MRQALAIQVEHPLESTLVGTGESHHFKKRTDAILRTCQPPHLLPKDAGALQMAKGISCHEHDYAKLLTLFTRASRSSQSSKIISIGI